MDAGSDHGSVGKGLAKDLEVAGSGLVGCHFSIPSAFFTMFSSQPCLSTPTDTASPYECVMVTCQDTTAATSHPPVATGTTACS